MENKKVLITGHTGFKGSWLSIWIKMRANIAGYSINPITKINFFELAKLGKIFKYDYRKNIQDYDSLEMQLKV